MAVLRMLKKWNFWRKARNRHGIHSPFIYRFLDEGLYRKELRQFPPQRRLLIAAADHFSPARAGSLEPQGQMAAWLKTQRTGIRWAVLPYDLFICDNPGEDLLHFLDMPDHRGNDTVVFVGNLRKNKEAYAYWRRATRHRAVRVAFETYPAGLLFFRAQQARQHFRIRI